MSRELLQIGRSSDKALSPAVSIERLLNCYMEQAPQGKVPQPVYGTPGLVIFATLGSGPIRGELETVETAYAVSGTGLYRVTSAGVGTLLGTVSGTGLVDMASDGTTVVCVTEAGLIFVWNGAAVVQVTDPDAPLASSVSWINGIYVFTEKDTEQFFISPMNDPDGDYQALDFDSSDTLPDKLVRTTILGRTLATIGRQSFEFWAYTGDSTFPFERYDDDPVTVGQLGTFAGIQSNGAYYFLANDKTVRRLDGRTATRISTYAMGLIIKAWSDPEATVVSAHVWNDHLMIVFRNPEGCIVFDQASQLWHERGSYELDSWRCRSHITCYDRELFGSATDGRIYALDADAYDEAGEILTFEMITPYAWAGGMRGSINELEVVVEPGVGGLVQQPIMIMERTEDGKTWKARRERSMGRAGNYLRRVLFGRQGASRGAAFRIRITDPIKRVLLAIFADVEIER
jgi:hypothetical protein